MAGSKINKKQDLRISPRVFCKEALLQDRELRRKRKLAGMGEDDFNFGLIKFEVLMTCSGGNIQKAVGDSSLEFKRTTWDSSAENCKLYVGKDFVPLGVQ